MENKDHHRSGAQTATNLARAARAIYNIIRAALAAGLYVVRQNTPTAAAE